MRKKITLILFTFLLLTQTYSQYADLGTGNLKDKIWWVDWAGFTVANNASKTFTTTDGLTVTITFSNVALQIPQPSVMNTWPGAILHLLYNFSNTSIQPALYSVPTTVNSQFSLSITATRNGLPTPFTLITADAEASATSEITTLTTNGSNWTTIDFFRNSLQTSNPLIGCNTKTVKITDTYSGLPQNGQNPVISTTSPTTGPLNIDVYMDKSGLTGGMALAFGIFAPVDRGDLPASYGFAQHQLSYTYNNSCNFNPPYPSIIQNEDLKIGNLVGDADGIQTNDDNATGIDEDGVNFFPFYNRSGSYSLTIPLTNATANAAYITGWFDYNQNGVFDNNESVAATIAPGSTGAFLEWVGLPPTLPTSNFAFRFRYSSDRIAVQSPSGFAKDGEVEDYFVPIYTPSNVIAGFTAPNTVCLNTPVTITNTSSNATTYLWNFCTANINSTPTGVNLGNPGNVLSVPGFMELVYSNGNYYGFSANYTATSGSLVRLDFGNSLLNNPTATNLGNFGGSFPAHAQGLQVVQSNGQWYVIVVGGNPNVGDVCKIVKVELGTDVANNTPTLTDWGNRGGLSSPIQLHIFQEGGNWYGLTINSESGSSITRFSFGSNFNNIPIGANLGNIGGLNHPAGINVVNNNGYWYAFVTNSVGSTLTRLEFGNSLTNTPTGVNLGNPGNVLNDPRGIRILKYCSDSVMGFVTNGEHAPALVRLNFNAGLLSTPVLTNLGNLGNLSFPHSITIPQQIGADLYFFVTNVSNNTITRFKITSQCSGVSTPSSTNATPPTFSYSVPGIYNLSLTVDEGLPTQTSFCRQIVVTPPPAIDFNYSQDICNPKAIQFQTNAGAAAWDFGNGTQITNNPIPTIAYNSYGIYTVQLNGKGVNGCDGSVIKQVPVQVTIDSAVITRDTALCASNNFAGFKLNALPALKYCWSPAVGLLGTDIQNPIISNTIPTTTYYLNAMLTGPNLVVNGDFSQGNSGFSSDYTYNYSSGFNEGVYAVRSDILSWYSGMRPCSDKTTGTGNMLLVNGAPTLDTKVWSQAITVKPNTNYAFSAWLEHITFLNPAQLQFSINGIQLGQTFTANPQGCVWEQFYIVWNSGSNTSATISIVNKNTILNGNDFALDDISFSELKIVRDSVKIAVHPSPTIDFNYTIPFCKSPQLSGIPLNEPSPINRWQWNFGDNKAADAQTLTHLYSNGGIYHVKLLATDVNGCKDSITKTIQVDTATAVAAYSGPVCPGGSVTLLGTGGTHYEWTPDVLVSDPASPNPTATITTNTRFNLKVTNAIGCEDTTTLIAGIITKPSFKKPADTQVCKGNIVVLNADANLSYQYTWNPANGLSDPNTASPTATPETNNTYNVHITEPVCGYDTSFTVKILVSPGLHMFILPNVFTPNGDGKNDCFGIRNWGNVTVHEFSIYNRWGQKLFGTKDPSRCWDGKYNGQLQPSGAYIYIIKALTPCGEAERKGSFMLIR